MSEPLHKGEWVKGVAHWRDGGTAFISVAFTWRLPEARKIAEYYRAIGINHVRVGGPGTFTQKKYVAEFADEIGGSIPDAIARHNPMATRASYGCPVGCWFCIVPKMDGKEFTLLPDFSVRPVLCDDNLSALPADYLVGEYNSAKNRPLVKAEAWNLIADFAVEHAEAICSALARRSAASAEPAVAWRAPLDEDGEPLCNCANIGECNGSCAPYIGRPPSPVVSEAMVEASAHAMCVADCETCPERVEREWDAERSYYVKFAKVALNAALSPAPAGEVYRPVEIRNDEAGYVEFVNADVPFIVCEIDGHVAILLDMETRNIIGYRVYDSAPVGEAGDEAISDALAAWHGTPIEHGDESPAMRNAIRAAARMGDTVWRFKLYASDGWTYTDRPLSPKELGPSGRQEKGHFPTGGNETTVGKTQAIDPHKDAGCGAERREDQPHGGPCRGSGMAGSIR